MVVGGIGLLGGYVVSPDTVEGITHRSQAEVWDTAVEIVSIMGVIQEKFEKEGLVVGKVNNTLIRVNIIPLSDSTVKIAVKARRSFFPKIKTAQDVYIKIVSQLSD